MKPRFSMLAVALCAAPAAVACHQFDTSSDKPGVQTESPKPSSTAQQNAQPTAGPYGNAAPASDKSAASAPIGKGAENPSMTGNSSVFEGEIKLDYRPAKAKTALEFTYFIKGNLIRYDETPAATKSPSRAVVDLTHNTILAVRDDKRQYVEVNASSDLSPGDDIEIEHTGKVDTVAGFSCEEWRLVDSKSHESAEACVAVGIPYFMLREKASKGEPEPAWASALTHNRAFPLRLIRRDDKGEEIAKSEVRWMEQKRLDDSLFVLPSDGKKIESRPGMKLPGVS